MHKRLTTPEDPSVAALLGVSELAAMVGVDASEIGEIVHGTTLVTNTVIERNGARLSLLTTEGFRDLLEIGTEQCYDIYSLFLKVPEPLVSRDLRMEVRERMDRDGNVVTELDTEAVRRALSQTCGRRPGDIAL